MDKFLDIICPWCDKPIFKYNLAEDGITSIGSVTCTHCQARIPDWLLKSRKTEVKYGNP